MISVTRLVRRRSSWPFFFSPMWKAQETVVVNSAVNGFHGFGEVEFLELFLAPR
jgi:hypothetical protein